jgi:quercetin dioxygenase-like cupin family protein
MSTTNHMKIMLTSLLGLTDVQPKPTDPNPPLPARSPLKWGLWKTMLTLASLASGICCPQITTTLSVTPVSQGLLPSGDIIVVELITLDPGDAVPWHYHTGRGWGTITTGTLTEDEGCDSPLNTLAAGSAFAEIPGRVHRVFNDGSVPAVFCWVEIYPACDPNNGTIVVNGPKCIGNSGKSRLEKVPSCGEAAVGPGVEARPGVVASVEQLQVRASSPTAVPQTSMVRSLAPRAASTAPASELEGQEIVALR